MKRTNQAIAITVAVLAASIAAFGQERTGNRGRAKTIEATVEAFGLTQEQVDQIREIRRQRPPRNQSRSDFQAWRDDQHSKIQDVLTDEQKQKVADVEAARAEMRAYTGALFLGLTDAPASPRGMRPGPRTSPRAARRARPGNRAGGRPAFRQSSRSRPAPAVRASNRGPRGFAGPNRGPRPQLGRGRAKGRGPARG